MAHNEEPVAAARRQFAEDALGSVKAEGLEPSGTARDFMDQVTAGGMGAVEAEHRLLNRYQR